MHGHVVRRQASHPMATGQELTPGQNAWSRGEEDNHAMATGQELTPGQNASLDIRWQWPAAWSTSNRI